MHLTLTDHLTCPRCGPSAGLILLMESMEDRRVAEGSLGCPVCRTQYRIAGRVADLRTGDSGGGGGGGGGTAGGGSERVADGAVAETALRVAALSELGEERAFLLLDGPAALAVAAALRGHLPDVEPVVALGSGDAAGARSAEVSALLDSGALPVADRTMRAAAYVGGVPDRARLAELVRVTRPTGRVVLETEGRNGALDAAAATLAELGAVVRARDATGLVAVVF